MMQVMKAKFKPAGKPCFAIANAASKDFYCYDGGPHDGAVFAFASREEADEFIKLNELENEAFVVDLSAVGAH
jgi:hypothetical protein